MGGLNAKIAQLSGKTDAASVASLTAYGDLMASLPADIEAAKTSLSTATLRSKYGSFVSSSYLSKVDTNNKKIVELQN